LNNQTNFLFLPRIKHNQSEILQISINNEQDGGTFTCLASNSIGKSEKHFFVDIFLPPTFDFVLTNRHKTQLNRTYTLPCLVKGMPRPTIKWLKNGKKLSIDVKYFISFLKKILRKKIFCVLEKTYGIISR